MVDARTDQGRWGVPLIHVDSLTREFTVTERDSGLGGALRSVVRRHSKSVIAVRDVSFTVGRHMIMPMSLRAQKRIDS